MHGTTSGEILGPLNVEKSRLRELSLVNDHNMYELAKNANARGGSHVHAKWLQDHKGDEVRCRLVATQLALGERLDVTQSTPPLMLAWLLLAIVSLRVDENETHDRVIGLWNVPVALYHAKLEESVYVHGPRGTCPCGYCWKVNSAMSGTRAARRAWCGLVKDTQSQRWCDQRGSSADDVHAQ